MVNKYSNSLIDFVPTQKERTRLDYLDLSISPQQMFDAIHYLSTHSIKPQSPPLKRSNIKINPQPLNNFFRAGAVISTAIAAVTGDYFSLTVMGAALGIDFLKHRKITKMWLFGGDDG